MRLSEGVEWGLHCLVLLAAIPEDRALPASRLAEYHEVAPAYLAKHLQALSRAGLVATIPGRRGGYRLARPAAEITALQAVEAIEGAGPAFRCTEIRQGGPAALPASSYWTVCAIHRVMGAAEAAWRAALSSVTIADLVGMVVRDADPAGLAKGARWLQEAVR
jgi:Rrf2 family protein